MRVFRGGSDKDLAVRDKKANAIRSDDETLGQAYKGLLFEPYDQPDDEAYRSSTWSTHRYGFLLHHRENFSEANRMATFMYDHLDYPKVELDEFQKVIDTMRDSGCRDYLLKADILAVSDTGELVKGDNYCFANSQLDNLRRLT